MPIPGVHHPDRLRHPALLWLIAPGAFLYSGLVGIRNALYDAGILKPRSLPCPVIAIGNLTVGGTGKTPIAAWVAGSLRDTGRRVAVLSRGYGRRGGGTRLVSDGRQILLEADRAGDEPYLIARDTPGVVVAVGADRAAAASLVRAATGAPDLIVLDDGFQHRRLRRDLDIVLVDGVDPWGNGRMLPRGPLREPVKSLERADAIVVTRSTGTMPPELAAALDRYNPRARVMHCRLESDGFLRVEGDPVDPAALRGFATFVFSGIARPERFEDDVRRLGLRIVGTRRFADHHRYRAADLREIEAAARTAGAGSLTTTEKDLVRIVDPAPAGLPIHALRLRVVFRPGDDPRAWILERLAAAGAAGTAGAGARR